MRKAKPNEQEVFERVVKVIENLLRTVNRDISAQLKRETNIYSDLGIDSVEVMDFLGLIEAEFDITIDVEKTAGKQSIGDITKFVLSCL